MTDKDKKPIPKSLLTSSDEDAQHLIEKMIIELIVSILKNKAEESQED
ncbi:MAG: hypothetical protein R6U68_07045 [Desulfobacteraceae bacterium]